MYGNSADNSGGIYITGLGQTTLQNCILWGNYDDGGSGETAQIFSFESPVIVDYSCIQGWTGAWGGLGNTGAAPLFRDPANGDVHLLPGSPAIDAGDNTALSAEITTDLDGNPRFVDDPHTPDTGHPLGAGPLVDMGAFEFGAADCNSNGITDVHDLADATSADCNSNGVPDECDFGELLMAPPSVIEQKRVLPPPPQSAESLPTGQLQFSRRCILRENDRNGDCVLDECE